jgi:hypothetical protein
MWESPIIVRYDHRRSRSKAKRPPIDLTCGRIVVAKPKPSALPKGVPDEQQRSIIIQRYLEKQR